MENLELNTSEMPNREEIEILRAEVAGLELSDVNTDELADTDLLVYKKLKEGRLNFQDLERYKAYDIGAYIEEICEAAEKRNRVIDVKRLSRMAFFDWLSEQWQDLKIKES